MGTLAIAVESTVGQLVVERPERARLFEKIGIDYCCGGKRTLSEACKSKGLNLSAVITMLAATEEEPDDGEFNDVRKMSLTELVDHIERTHHAYLKRELPRLQGLIERIGARHGEKNPGLLQLIDVYSSFRSELEAHTAKEEQILFPLIRKSESRSNDGHCDCGEIEKSIRSMENEHQHVGDAMQIMRQLTRDFAIYPDSCNTYVATMDALQELERDLHLHVHQENCILFPRAIGASVAHST